MPGNLVDVAAEAADVIRLPDGDRGHSRLPGLVQTELGGAAHRDLSKPPVALDNRHYPGLANDLHLCIREDLLLFDRGEILGQADDAMGVVAGFVRFDEQPGYQPGFVLRCSRGDQDSRRVFDQFVRSEGRHMCGIPTPDSGPEPLRASRRSVSGYLRVAETRG